MTVNSQQYADRIRQGEGTHSHIWIPTEAMHSVSASPSMDVSVNSGPLSSISLQSRDAAAGAKGVPHRCLTKGVPPGHMANTGDVARIRCWPACQQSQPQSGQYARCARTQVG